MSQTEKDKERLEILRKAIIKSQGRLIFMEEELAEFKYRYLNTRPQFFIGKKRKTISLGQYQ